MNPQLATEIQAEQEHGRQKYGTDPNDFGHDDHHTRQDWIEFIQAHAERGELEVNTPMEWRQRMLKIAGLAISGIESLDRKGGGTEKHESEQWISDAHKPKAEPPQDLDYEGRIVNAETQGEKI